MSESIPELDLLAMERDVRKWREKSIDAYRAEVSCVNRMRHEIIHLRALVSSQQSLITSLALDSKKMQHERYQIGELVILVWLYTEMQEFRFLSQFTIFRVI